MVPRRGGGRGERRWRSWRWWPRGRRPWAVSGRGSRWWSGWPWRRSEPRWRCAGGVVEAVPRRRRGDSGQPSAYLGCADRIDEQPARQYDRPARSCNPILLVADRGNNRIVRYTLDDKPIDVVAGTLSPAISTTTRESGGARPVGSRHPPGQEQQDRRAFGRRTRGNPPGTTETAALSSRASSWRRTARCFDHNGNIFVVEWVEIGRVTKLRKLA